MNFSKRGFMLWVHSATESEGGSVVRPEGCNYTTLSRVEFE